MHTPDEVSLFRLSPPGGKFDIMLKYWFWSTNNEELLEPGEGELPYKEYTGVCHELGSYFQENIPKRVQYVNFSQKFRKGL